MNGDHKGQPVVIRPNAKSIGDGGRGITELNIKLRSCLTAWSTVLGHLARATLQSSDG